ncbi:glycosyltransferase family 39 protein [bacterium]|nr:glycosyltransferase family 39 protein [candidate division CSSED10-310 bacterium]
MTHKTARFLLLGAILLLAFLVRYPGLGLYGLWRDELIGARYAELPVTTLLESLKQDVHPPLFFLLQKIQFYIVGYDAWTEGNIRFLPLIIGLITIVVIFFAGERLISPRAGYIAAFLLAINPMHVHYSREARNYCLLILLVLLTIWTTISFLKKKSLISGLLASLSVIALIYTHNIIIFALIPLLPFYFLPIQRLNDSRYRNTLFLMMFLILVFSYPIFSNLIHQAKNVAETKTRGSGPCEWLKPYWEYIFPYQIPMTFSVLSHGSYPPCFNHVFIREQYKTAFLSGSIGVFLLAFGYSKRRRWRQPQAGTLLLSSLIAPLCLIFAVSCFSTPIYTTGRADTIALPSYILLVAAGIDAFLHRSGHSKKLTRNECINSIFGGLSLIILAGCSIKPISYEMTSDYKDFQKLWMSYLAIITKDNDVFIINHIDRLSFEYYLPRLNRNLLLVGFPSARDKHPLWLDWSSYNKETLAIDAKITVAKVCDLAKKNRSSVWLEEDYKSLGFTILLSELNHKMPDCRTIFARPKSYKVFSIAE